MLVLETAKRTKAMTNRHSPDTRLLVELTSHADDLSEAAHSLSKALDSGEGSDVREPLTSHAVTTYMHPTSTPTSAPAWTRWPIFLAYRPNSSPRTR